MRARRSLLVGFLAVAGLLPVGAPAVSASTAPPLVSGTRFDPREEFGFGVDTDGGVSASIVGGAEISITDAPWQILLVDFDPVYWPGRIGQAYFPFCGGSIINSLWIVTAAHCVDDSNGWPFLRIAAGVTAKSGIPSASFVDVVQVLVHENWNPSTDVNDIALLKLEAPLDLSGDSRRAIDLPMSVGATWPQEGTNALISGWGTLSSGGATPDLLRGATIKVLASPGPGSCGGYGSSYVPSSMVCAGVNGGGKDTCQGDSGGPMAIQVNSRWTLAGITSWGSGCAEANFPGLYTRVTSYLDWIISRSALTWGAPTITSIESRNRSLAVVFDPPVGIAAWQISNFAYSIDGGSWTALRPAATSGPIIINRLTNGRTYAIRVAAVSAQGRGAASDPVAGTPLPDLPSAPSIRSIAPGDSSLQISYRAPSNTGGAPVTGYEYSLDGGASWTPAANGSRGALLVTGLTNGTPVSASIRAVNMRGGGAASGTSSATPRRVPDAPAIIGSARAPRTASVSFTPPGFNGGASITTYEYSIDGGRWTAIRPASTATPIVITRLTDSRSYSVRIRAVNSAGGGTPSNPWTIDPLVVG